MLHGSICKELHAVKRHLLLNTAKSHLGSEDRPTFFFRGRHGVPGCYRVLAVSVFVSHSFAPYDQELLKAIFEKGHYS